MATSKTRKTKKSTEQLTKEAIAAIDKNLEDAPKPKRTRKPRMSADAARVEGAAKVKRHLKAVAAADQENARLRDDRAAAADGATASEQAMTASQKPKKTKKAAGRKPKAETNGKLSGLDAAAQILGKAKEPMGCKDLVEQAISQGLWAPGGKTPGATLYAAIIREIASKGKDARFQKVARGRFALAAKKGA